jgi:hypothetical protein
MKKLTLAIVALSASMMLAACASDETADNSTTAASTQSMGHQDYKGEKADVKGEKTAQ